ncbi:MAG: hypothetical protein WCF65_05060 [Parachlamydiaceae bacterium]
MISSVTSSLATGSRLLEFIPKCCSAVLFRCHFLVDKVRHVAYSSFVAGSGAYHCGWGTAELSGAMTNTGLNKGYKLAPSLNYQIIHGTFIGATGVCGVLEGLNSFGWINYGKIATTVCSAGSIFFLYANIAALEESVRIYEELQKHEIEGGLVEQEKNAFRKCAAIWGILSNLGYIVATACVLFGASTAMAFVFGVIGTLSGAFKFICDMLL